MTRYELDAAVAEKVMGFVGRDSWESWFEPATRIENAWQVVEKMRSDGWEVTVGSWEPRVPLKLWVAEYQKDGKLLTYAEDTAQRAICLGALAALDGKATPPRNLERALALSEARQNRRDAAYEVEVENFRSISTRLRTALEFYAECRHYDRSTGCLEDDGKRAREVLAACQVHRKYIQQCERVEDMSPDGRLKLFREKDGDIIVSIIPPTSKIADNFQAGRRIGACSGFELRDMQVQFCCTGAGGGRSPNTRLALFALMEAIEADNKERPI